MQWFVQLKIPRMIKAFSWQQIGVRAFTGI